jgi:S1-C subfamily serine protease
MGRRAFPENDIALVKLEDTTGLVAAVIGDSDAMKVGDDVVAIGNALGLGVTPTVTRGIISAKDRTLQVSEDVELSGLLQTDAAINHGNSGGALINAAGEVIGINSAGIPDAQNLGFAIASNVFKPLIEKIKSGGGSQVTAPAKSAVLGVTTIADQNGVLVTGVNPGSGADSAGIEKGDVIVSVDGQTIQAPEDLGASIRTHKPGDVIQVTLVRGSETKTVQATLGTR